MAEPTVPPDPIRTKSLSGPIAISTVLLIITTAWAVWDEGVHKRPYLDYQGRWIDKFGAFLTRLEPEYAAAEQAAAQSPEMQALDAKFKAVSEQQAPAKAAVENELNAIDPKLKAMDFQFRDRKGLTDQYINRIENAHDEESKEKLRKELAEYRAETFDVVFADGTKQQYTGPALIKEFLELKLQQGLLQAKLGQLSAPVQAVEKERLAQMAKLTRGASTGKITALKNELDKFEKGIKQIHVPEMRDLVDRCESCHLGVRSSIPIRPEDMDGERVFASHPNPALLQIHDPEKFGCSPCHNGNGVAVISEEIAHGRYHHWLWPMPQKENIEAGCVQCHLADLVIDHAPVLNHGKETFRFRGCWSCHRYDGFETESDQLIKVQKDLRELAVKGDQLATRVGDARDAKIAVLGVEPGAGDVYSLAALPQIKRDLVFDIVSKTGVFPAVKRAALVEAIRNNRLTEEERNLVAEALEAEQPALTQQLSAVDTSRATAQHAEKEQLLEVKRVGPSLKEVRMKIKPEWLPGWIADPAKFRPTTKMPTYAQLASDPEQATAIAAFLWKRGVEGPLAKSEPGDPKRGERLVRDRGCLGCHSSNVGGELIGNTFAAELTRVGEKDNFDYLVRWVSDPKQRTLPYSYGLKRDLTPEDFQKAGVKLEFETPNAAWPKEWGTLLTHQMTVMPNLRLSPADARDIASYLVDQKTAGATYPAATAVTNASDEVVAQGEKLVKHYGCASCHEIAGLEDFQKIGTELTKEGSKPIERLDFGHFTNEAKRSGHEHGWYTPKGFFDRKLANPQVWDEGKEIASVGTPPTPNFQETALRMPNFRLSKEDIDSVSTFLIGSVESGIPSAFMNLPQDQRKAIQEGWWVVKKYNCAGCHAMTPGEKPALWATPWFEAGGSSMTSWKDANGEEHRGGADRRPPTLVGEGARVDPQWLSEFLRNPALSKTNVHRNGLRPYLNVRMPTFDLSENEIGKLVRFFGAISHQPLPYVRPEQTPLTADEAKTSRAILAQVCAKCHATSDTTTFSADVNAPDFRYAQARLKPAWMTRLVQTPGALLPGTNMPPWFNEQGGRWVFKEPWPAGHPEFKGDQVDLMVRFLSQYNNPGIGK
jgi:cytochrome c551/c552